jgi:hypothetical protein
MSDWREAAYKVKVKIIRVGIPILIMTGDVKSPDMEADVINSLTKEELEALKNRVQMELNYREGGEEAEGGPEMPGAGRGTKHA